MAPRTKKQKELGIIGKQNRSKKETPMLESIQSTRRLEQAAMKGKKVSPKLNTTLADIVRVKRGSKYKGQGNVPTLKQEKERAAKYGIVDNLKEKKNGSQSKKNSKKSN